MYRSKDVLTHDALVEHDSILIVVTLPRHVCHKEITAQSQLAVFSGIALGKDVALLHTLPLVADRTQVDGHVLVRAAELRNTVFLQSWLKRDELLVLGAVVKNTDGCSIDIFDDTVALGGNHGARILTHLLLYTSAHDRSFVVEQGNCLTHHVRAHECTVSIVVLQEGDERGGDRGYLLRRHVHEVNV